RARRENQIRSAELGEHLFQLDGKHPALVHLAPALVGPPDSGLVWAGQQSLRRVDRSRSAGGGGQALRQGNVTPPRRGRARHLVLLRTVAVLDARLAGQDEGARA